MKHFWAGLGQGVGCLLMASAVIVLTHGSIIIKRLCEPKTPTVQSENSGK